MAWFKKEKKSQAETDTAHFDMVMATYQKYPEFPYINLEPLVMNERVRQLATGELAFVKPELMNRTEEGYLIGELIFLEWLEGKSADIKEFPDFFEILFGINPQETVLDLLNDDYLDIVEDQQALFYWSLEDLNNLLSEHDLPSGTSHEEIIDRLNTEFSADFLADFIGRGNYVTMSAGQELLKKYQAELTIWKEKFQL